MDYLGEMLNLQEDLNKYVSLSKESIQNLSEDELCFWLSRFNSAQICESGEFWKEIGRWWRTKESGWEERAKEELIDEFHFLLSKALLLGMDSEEIYKIYKMKNEKNHHREKDHWKYKEEK